MTVPYQFARALIVDDDKHVAQTLSRMLATWNTPTITASTVQQAMDMLATGPDLVITDIRLPDGSGHRVVASARAASPSPVVVAMSGVASAAEAFELAQLGAHIYLGKPFSAAQLASKIEELVNETSRHGHSPVAANIQEFASRHKLTQKQAKLIQLAISGTLRRDFPTILGVTENTCKTMIRRLLHKCGARSLADIPRLMLLHNHDVDA